jgi:hypothetical protein
MRRIAGLVIVAVLAAASSVGGTDAAASVGSRRLPPPSRDSLARIFDPMLEDLGLRTTRALLQNLDTYEEDPQGRHLAVYVEPIDEASYTDAEYVQNFTDLAKIFLPKVFKRWKGLESFDVCQEPRAADDPSEIPPSRTQILVSRVGAGYVRWKSTDLAELIATANEHEGEGKNVQDFSVYFEQSLGFQPDLIAATDAAKARSAG